MQGKRPLKKDHRVASQKSHRGGLSFEQGVDPGHLGPGPQGKQFQKGGILSHYLCCYYRKCALSQTFPHITLCGLETSIHSTKKQIFIRLFVFLRATGVWAWSEGHKIVTVSNLLVEPGWSLLSLARHLSYLDSWLNFFSVCIGQPRHTTFFPSTQPWDGRLLHWPLPLCFEPVLVPYKPQSDQYRGHPHEWATSIEGINYVSSITAPWLSTDLPPKVLDLD